MSRFSGSRSNLGLLALAALVACALPLTAVAQDTGGGSRRTTVEPYIEAGQVVTAELSPGDEVLTYSVIAAGVDAEIAGANNAASVSVRYEYRIGWGDSEDGDVISGIARGYSQIAPGVRIDAGGLATRSRVEEDGSSVLGPLRDDDSATQIYSLYVGPTVTANAGDVAITGTYRFGYTKVEAVDAFTATPGAPAVDVFDESTAHIAGVRAGVKPYDVLPVGLGIGANYYREDITNLDQRVEDFNARADVTFPVSPTLAFVGGVGYENVEISGRDAVRDGLGNPVIGPDGRFVTDKSGPRFLAFEAEGFIWDVGVMWRPSRRTSLEAHIGRRYDTTSYYGSFAYTPNSRSSFNLAVYDNVAGFGGQINRALADLPEEFTAVRNPLTGEIGGCVATLEQGGCLSNVLGSVRSATFRARGVMATYGMQLGRISTGVGAGYDRRRFLAAAGTVLASSNGLIDENYWLTGYVNGRLDARSGFSVNVFANWFKPGEGRDVSAVGATASVNRHLADRLSATFAVGIDGVNEEAPFEDFWTAKALIGLRYSF